MFSEEDTIFFSRHVTPRRSICFRKNEKATKKVVRSHWISMSAFGIREAVEAVSSACDAD
jgi:hypothetical protein